MLPLHCGLMHKVTSAVSLQVQCVVTLLHYFKYAVTMYFLCTSVTFLVVMCTWQKKVILIMTQMTVRKHVDTGTLLRNFQTPQ